MSRFTTPSTSKTTSGMSRPERPSLSTTASSMSLSATPSNSSRKPTTHEDFILSFDLSNLTEQNFSSQEELEKYLKEVGGTIVSGKELETMLPQSSEVIAIETIERHQNMEPILPNDDVELKKIALHEDLFKTVNGKYTIFDEVSQKLDAYLEESKQELDEAFAEDEVEEMDPEDLKMVINLLMERVKSLRCLAYLENLKEKEVTTIPAYNDRNRFESIIGVLHNSPNSREHYGTAAIFIEKILDLIVGDAKPPERNVLSVLVPESFNFAIMDLFAVNYKTATKMRKSGLSVPQVRNFCQQINAG